MVVLFEFLGNEPLENVVTCMNFAVDKVVYFGYLETILAKKETTDRFLKEVCGVEQTVFWPLSHTDLQSVLNTMRKEIDQEVERGEKIFFDITGGESLLLVAFGMLSKEYRAPMHMYDIRSGNLIELDGDEDVNISQVVPAREIKLTLDMFIELQGGKINYYLQKEIKESQSDKTREMIEKIWAIVCDFPSYWTLYSHFLNNSMDRTDLRFSQKIEMINMRVMVTPNILKDPETIYQITEALHEAGLVKDIVHDDETFGFSFVNEAVMDIVLEAGSVVEMLTYQWESERSDECKIGVHLDWDGVIHEQNEQDVYNEIDVLSLTGYIPTFISCKMGKNNPKQVLYALYELDTVAGRFGGKYARKVLVVIRELDPLYAERAEEMGIEIMVCDPEAGAPN